jgi:hypothetical protein
MDQSTLATHPNIIVWKNTRLDEIFSLETTDASEDTEARPDIETDRRHEYHFALTNHLGNFTYSIC